MVPCDATRNYAIFPDLIFGAFGGGERSRNLLCLKIEHYFFSYISTGKWRNNKYYRGVPGYN